MALLLLAGQTVQAGACSCHRHGDELSAGESTAPAVLVTGMADTRGSHEDSGHDCSCACHDLATHAGNAVSTVVSIPAPPFSGKPCVSDLTILLPGNRVPADARPVWPREAPPPSAAHRGFVCPLRA